MLLNFYHCEMFNTTIQRLFSRKSVEFLRLKIMCLRVSHKKKIWKKINIFFASLRSPKNGVGSWVGSGSESISQRHGYADPDPHQNVIWIPQHCPLAYLKPASTAAVWTSLAAAKSRHCRWSTKGSNFSRIQPGRSDLNRAILTK